MTPTLRFHTVQSPAALRTGTRVEKINSKRGDSHVNGAHGIINTSLARKFSLRIHARSQLRKDENASEADAPNRAIWRTG